MEHATRLDARRLATFRQRAETLRRLSQSDQGDTALPVEEGRQALHRARRVARPLFEHVVSTYEGLCPAGYPVVEDNEIEGSGGSTGVRFSRWHAFFVALSNVKRPKPEEAKPAGLAGALGVQFKRMPGQPLPPPDPQARVELATLALRWDEERGWVEVRRVLPRAWDVTMLEEHFAAFLLGLNYDVAAGMDSDREAPQTLPSPA